LLLTKPLGTGILTTALKRQKLSEKAYDAAVRSMTLLNRTASELMLRYEVHAATDVTGFGLLGHGHEMARGSEVTLRIESAALPLLPDVDDCVVAGHLTGGCKRNRSYLDGKVRIAPHVRETLREVAYDPQTSGGLLIALPPSDADRLLDDLQKAGMEGSRRIGSVLPRSDFWVDLV
jgi:selenide,water dikinase